MEPETFELADFQRKYALPEAEAERLFKKFGPTAMALDILMRGKLDRAAAGTSSRRKRPVSQDLLPVISH